MKKSIFLKTLTTASILALMTPLTANAAAKLESNTTGQMNVGDTVDVKVTTEVPVEMMQFDLSFDKAKFTYEGMETELDKKGSNLIDDKGIVRVSTYDETGDKTNSVTLKFKAQTAGDAGVFSINNARTIELGDGADTDTFDTNAMKVASITITGQNGEETTTEYDGYTDENGEKLKSLPRTGAIESLGKFSKLGNLTNVIPYALKDSDDRVTLKDVKDQYTVTSTGNDTDIMKTGDTVGIEGVDYTIVIYGDINKDGKVSTKDLLMTHKNNATLDNYQKEAADVQNDGIVNNNDIVAMHAFILEQEGFIVNNPDRTTIIDKNPIKLIENGDIRFTSIATGIQYTNTTVEVAKVEAVTEGVVLTKELLSATTVAGAQDPELIYDITPDGKTATIKLKVVSTGNYTVTPIVKGTDVEGGELKGNDVTFTVETNKAITNVRFFKEDGTEITNNAITLDAGATGKVVVKFYYTDNDGEKEINTLTTQEVTKVVTDANNGLNEHQFLNASGNPVTSEAINSIQMQAKELGIDTTATINIVVNNSAYKVANYDKKTLTVNVKKSSKVGLKLNGATPANASVNIYSTAPAVTDTMAENISGTWYTVLPITYADGTSKYKAGNVIADMKADHTADAKAGNVVIYTNTDNMKCINVKIEKIKYVNGVATIVTDPDEEFDKLAIKPVVKTNGSFYIRYYDERGNEQTITYTYTVDPVAPNRAPSPSGPQGGALQGPSGSQEVATPKSAATVAQPVATTPNVGVDGAPTGSEDFDGDGVDPETPETPADPEVPATPEEEVDIPVEE